MPPFFQDQPHSWVLYFLPSLVPLSGGWGLRSVYNSFSAPSFSHFPPAPVWALNELQFLQEIPNCSGAGSSPGCGVNICSNVVFSMGSREISAPVHLLPPPSFLTLVFILLFLTFFPPHSSASLVFSQRCHPLGCWAGLCPAVGPSWSCLELSVADMGQLLQHTFLAAKTLTGTTDTGG